MTDSPLWNSKSCFFCMLWNPSTCINFSFQSLFIMKHTNEGSSLTKKGSGGRRKRKKQDEIARTRKKTSPVKVFRSWEKCSWKLAIFKIPIELEKSFSQGGGVFFPLRRVIESRSPYVSLCRVSSLVSLSLLVLYLVLCLSWSMIFSNRILSPRIPSCLPSYLVFFWPIVLSVVLHLGLL